MISLERLSNDSIQCVTLMVGELLQEIMRVIDSPVFDFDHDSTASRLSAFLADGIYDGFVAFDGEAAVGFATVYQSHSLYGNGAYGTIPELYVRPAHRSSGVGNQLLAALVDIASERGWTMLEVTTPPLPGFDRTLAFYERSGFEITGGRKLKLKL
ncbi:GNAT family N-acetyltransferase [bacterium]|nr:GNAT family N-acetyltransferase [bacterium]